MMQSLFAGVSGLRSHQRRMDVIGNNVANVNTIGFKAARTTFQDVLYNTLRGAGAPQSNRGGTNPMQVGLGVQVASIDTVFTPGNPQSTGVDTDLMIQGDGLFVVSDGQKNFYTRAGNFFPDADGTLVTPGGYTVLGWRADPATGTINVFQPIAPLKIEKGSVIAATATQNISLAGNIDAGSAVGDTIRTPSKVVYDSLGNPHELYVELGKTNPNEWNTYRIFVDGNDVTALATPPAVDTDPPGAPIVFDGTTGRLDVAGGSATAITVVGLDPGDLDPDNGAANMDLRIELLGLTQFADETTAKIASQDGFPSGTLERFAFDSNGIITGYYSNGLRRSLGQVAMALFTNPGGLERQGESLFAESPNSGTADIGAANSGGRGAILPSTLEMSNVELAQEFTDMILTQRGYQANSRVITTSDEMLQELVNLKR